MCLKRRSREFNALVRLPLIQGHSQMEETRIFYYKWVIILICVVFVTGSSIEQSPDHQDPFLISGWYCKNMEPQQTAQNAQKTTRWSEDGWLRKILKIYRRTSPQLIANVRIIGRRKHLIRMRKRQAKQSDSNFRVSSKGNVQQSKSDHL